MIKYKTTNYCRYDKDNGRSFEITNISIFISRTSENKPNGIFHSVFTYISKI